MIHCDRAREKAIYVMKSPGIVHSMIKRDTRRIQMHRCTSKMSEPEALRGNTASMRTFDTLRVLTYSTNVRVKQSEAERSGVLVTVLVTRTCMEVDGFIIS